MTTTTTFTKKQRQAIEALEGARREGVALSKYAQTHRLIIRELYDAITCLRRKGLLAKRTRKAGRNFVAIRVVAPGEPAQAVRCRPTGGALCRIVCPRSAQTHLWRPKTLALDDLP